MCRYTNFDGSSRRIDQELVLLHVSGFYQTKILLINTSLLQHTYAIYCGCSNGCTIYNFHMTNFNCFWCVLAHKIES